MLSYLNVRLLSFIVACVMWTSFVFGQNLLQTHQIEQFTIENGLQSNECHEIVQDAFGYIWIATDRGLMRYDGYSFKNYGLEEGLEDLVCIELVLDIHGDLWINTESANFFVYKRSEDRIVRYEHNDLLKAYQGISRIISPFYVDDRLHAFFSIPSFGYIEITDEGSLINHGKDIKYSEYEIIPLKDGFVLATYGDVLQYNIRNGKLEFDTYNFGQVNDTGRICLKGHCYSTPPLADQLVNLRHFCSQLDDDHFIFFGWGQNLLMNTSGSVHVLSGPPIISAAKTANQNVFIGRHRGGGLEYYSDLRNVTQGISQTVLTDVTITDVFVGMDESVWVSTLEDGVFLIKEKLVYPQEQDGLVGIDALQIEQIDRNVVGMSDKNYAAILDLSTSEILAESRRHEEIVNIRSRKDRLVISSESSSILTQSGERTIYNHKEDDYLTVGLRNLKDLGPDSLAILATSNWYLMEDIQDTMVLDPEGPVGLRYVKFNDLALHQGDMYFATDTGVVVRREQEYRRMDGPLELFRGRVNALDNWGAELVVATESSGLYIVGDSVNHLHNQNGLVSNSIDRIVINGSYLFACSYKGISILQRSGGGRLEAFGLTTEDGLPSNIVTDVELIGDALWICTSNGMCSVPINKCVFKDHQPTVERINDMVRPVLSEEPFEFNFGDKIAIQFKVINPANSRRIQYRYRLNDSEWQYTDQTVVSFDFLGHGNYVMEVESQQRDYAWSEPSRIYLAIAPPWYSQWWFYLLSALLISALAWVLIRWQYRRREREQSLQEHLRDLESKALKAQMNPHFIFNCLGSIQNFIMENDKAQAMEYLSRFAQLIRLNLRFSDLKMISMEDELDMMTQFLTLEQLRFNNRFEFEITHEASDFLDDVLLPPMLIQPYVENAVEHGMRQRGDGGLIEVHYEISENYIEVMVRDNGRGFDVAEERSQDSMGMKITEERLTHLSDSGRPDIRLESSPGKGCTVLLRFSREEGGELVKSEEGEDWTFKRKR